MKKRLFFAVASILSMVCVLMPQTGSAQTGPRALQPYVGGYFDYSPCFGVYKVLASHRFNVDIPPTSPNELMAVISVAGGEWFYPGWY